VKRLWLMLLCALLTLPTLAQQAFTNVPAAPRAVALMIGTDGLMIAQANLPEDTLGIDYNPADTSRSARIDRYGMVRYAPLNTSEGVYTFSPFYDGYGVTAPEQNKLFINQVKWSPKGDMLAFQTEQYATSDASNGVWFWQPARELSSDPSYQLLRHCPPSCIMIINPDALEWRTIDLEWSSDNNAILIDLDLISEKRRALAVRFAVRDQNNNQANTAPVPLRYDYGHWTLDGQNIVVSGRNPQGEIGFGVITRDNSAVTFTAANTVGMAWVQDAVQASDGKFYMFASSVGEAQPLQLVDEAGTPLTPLIGNSAPSYIEWNAERTAARVIVNMATYIVQINGTVTDITGIVSAVPAVAWVQTLPPNATLLATPAPLATGELVSVKIGDILQVKQDTVTVYSDPTGAEIMGTLNVGEELIIISDPVQSGATQWWKIQSINYTGWINSIANLKISGT
jgi:hypothetical protein